MLQNVVGSTRWSFVLIMTVISLIVGMLWYSKWLFGPAYMKAMHFTKDSKGPGMGISLVLETISRVLYFIGLWWIFVTWGQVTFSGALAVGVLVWLVYVFATQLSLITWTNQRKYNIWIVTGSVLVQTVIAAAMFSSMIR